VSTRGLVTLAELRAAQERLRGVAVHTPLVRLETPGEPAALWVKAEGLQPIGSFKLRGAYNKVAQLSASERARGVITYSSGNHAQGVAYAARALGAKAVIVMPSNAPQVKRKATLALGAEIVTVGPGSADGRPRQSSLPPISGMSSSPLMTIATLLPGRVAAGWRLLPTSRRSI
jgi:threonine dehydratase